MPILNFDESRRNLRHPAELSNAMRMRLHEERARGIAVMAAESIYHGISLTPYEHTEGTSFHDECLRFLSAIKAFEDTFNRVMGRTKNGLRLSWHFERGQGAGFVVVNVTVPALKPAHRH